MIVKWMACGLTEILLYKYYHEKNDFYFIGQIFFIIH